jgi:DNA-binding winged helix-turn-helix (wHTH) protein
VRGHLIGRRARSRPVETQKEHGKNNEIGRSSVPVGPFVLIPSEHMLLRNGKPLHLARRDFELLVVLVDHAGRLLRKEELQERLWPETVVEEGNLTKHVSTLRKALGEVDGSGALIETVPRVGFRFVAPVTCSDSRGAPPISRARGRWMALAVLQDRAFGNLVADLTAWRDGVAARFASR